MSKQEIGPEIWGEARSNDPSSLHTYVMRKKNKEATKAFSKFPFVWWGGGRRGLPTKHIPVSPVRGAGSLLTAQTTGCSRRELGRVLFSACLCPRDFVLNIFTSLQPPCLLESNALGAGAVSEIQAQGTVLQHITSHISETPPTTERRVNICCNSLASWDLNLSDTDAKASQKNPKTWKPHRLFSC